MPFFRLPNLPFLPSFGRSSRHSFNRLHSFHLSPEAAKALEGGYLQQTTPPSPFRSSPEELHVLPKHVVQARATPPKASPPLPPPPRAINGSVPIPRIFFFGLAILLSFIFVGTIMATFRGAQAGPPFFKSILDEVAEKDPGIVLLGENVDIDVDEPSVGIRWSILACGKDYVLPGSNGVHGSEVCGLPAFPMLIFVDGDTKPTASYNPAGIPFDRKKGERRNIQNLVQFDSDHVLDVHNDYLYPFDTYRLSSTLRATSLSSNQSVPIKKLATIEITSAFLVTTVDVESYSTGAPWQDQFSGDTQSPSRDIDMYIRRPAESRAIALILFAIGWFLTHICVGYVIMARGIAEVGPILKFLVVNGAVLVVLPQLRNSSPDAPDLDGVLIDTIGFFSQMIICGLCAVVLLLTVIARELDVHDRIPRPRRVPSNIMIPVRRRSSSASRDRPPPTPTKSSSAAEKAEYEKYRLTRHLKGQYVFPPVQIAGQSPEEAVGVHRRCQTVMGV